jgi:glycine/D-amino acid oxidase-like deaminating enzyme
VPGLSVQGAELAVVGAGVTGLFLAYELGELGAGSVVVYERTGIGAGASGVQPGGIRQQWGTGVNCVLARESLVFYRDAKERLGMRVDPGFQPCGYLFLAHSSATRARLAANVALQNELGVPSRIVEPGEAAKLVPGLDPSSLTGAAWCAEDGYLDRPQAVLEALGERATIVRADVIGLVPDGSRWRLELADGTSAVAGSVVVAAGWETRGLIPELPIEREARYLFLSEPIRERLLEPLVISPERHFAAKQLADGRVLASDLAAAGDPELEREAWRKHVRACVETLLPALEFVSLPLLVEGWYDVTPDHQAILGEVQPGLWVAAGFSGHGFMLAPAVGRILAEAIVLGREDQALRVLDARRFAEARLLPEPQVV